MPVLSLRHLTRYRYARPVAFGEHRIMMRPHEGFDQRVLEAELVIAPMPVELRVVRDAFGNCVAIARFSRRARELSIESRVRLEHSPLALCARADDVIRPSGGVGYDADELPDLAPSMGRRHTDPDDRVLQWARSFIVQGGSTGALQALSAMSRAVRRDFRYAQRLHGAAQTPAETLALHSGACRDFAVLIMEAARTLGFAAQFVSGYVHCPTPARGAARLGGGHTHAWVRVYLPSAGWVEFDPTNGGVGGEGLIRVAVARDPRQACPLVGSFDGEAADYLGMDVEVDVDAEAGWERDAAPLLKVA